MGQTSGSWDGTLRVSFFPCPVIFGRCYRVLGSFVRVILHDGVRDLVRAAGFKLLDGLEKFAYFHCIYGYVAYAGVLRCGSIFSREDTLELFQEDACILITITHEPLVLFSGARRVLNCLYEVLLR